MFNQYYQDELTYLREMGKEFAQAHPQVAHMLAETGTDPDVERLLEGFAFLAGRIRQRLDGELPELVHTLVGLLWPHYLRPIPALSIVQFAPRATLQDRQIIPRGAPMESTPVEGTRCRFQTTADVHLYPFTLTGANLEVPLARLATLRLTAALGPQANCAKMALGPLRMFLHGEPPIVNTLYLWLCRHTRSVTLKAGTREVRLPDPALKPVGFENAEPLWPYPIDAHPGYRLLMEFFSLPERYHFIDIVDLRPLAEMEVAGNFEIIIEFDEKPPDHLRVRPDMLRLACAPVVNLQTLRSAPIRLDHERTEYRLRPDTSHPEHYEIFSVDRVVGWVKGTVTEREFKPFFSFEHSLSAEKSTGDYYHTRLRPATVGAGTDTYVAFVVDGDTGRMPPTETVAVDLTCTNRNLAEKLHPGDICAPTSDSPAFAEFKNITRVTPTVPPPLESRLLWHLISHQSLNYLGPARLESLRAMLSVYNFPALIDRQAARSGELRLAGIRSVRTVPSEILHHGAVYRGVTIDMELHEDNFAGEGELYLFASVLNRFFNLFVTLNAFSRLRVKALPRGTVYEWPPILGQQQLL